MRSHANICVVVRLLDVWPVSTKLGYNVQMCTKLLSTCTTVGVEGKMLGRRGCLMYVREMKSWAFLGFARFLGKEVPLSLLCAKSFVQKFMVLISSLH